MKRIAVIGSGITGLSAAWALRQSAHVTLFEKSGRTGGHACTHVFDYDGKETSVDLGFIVYNALNYPNLIGFLDALGVETQSSDMSFSVSDPDGWEWASTLNGIFAQRGNLLSPSFHRFWRTILKFNDIGRAELADDNIKETTLGSWLDRHGFCEDFRNNYILPMGAAIWSTCEKKMLEYPAKSFFQFFDNHRLMHKERPKWRTVSGGSHKYVSSVIDTLGERVKLNTGITHIAPFGDHVALTTDNRQSLVFDQVIAASHSDQTLSMVRESYEEHAFLLKSVRYRRNKIYLHRDPNLMPKRKAAWASWNVLKQQSGDICLTYWMNRLQNIPDKRPLFITMNPDAPPRDELTFLEYEFDHPQFDAAAEAAVRGLKRIQGQDGLWVAGAWMGKGFHEDGLKAGLSPALSLGGSVPWAAHDIEIIQPTRTGRRLLASVEVSV